MKIIRTYFKTLFYCGSRYRLTLLCWFLMSLVVGVHSRAQEPASGQCADPMIGQYQQVISHQKYISQNLLKASTDTVAQIQKTGSQARFFALFFTVLFAASMAFLFGVGIWKMIARSHEFLAVRSRRPARQGLLWSLFYGHVYFVILLFLILHFSSPLKKEVTEFRQQLAPRALELPQLQNRLTLQNQIQNFISVIGAGYESVRQHYRLKSMTMPQAGHWWSFGWENVHLVEFEEAAFQAVRQRSQMTLEVLEALQPQLTKLCQENAQSI